MFPVFFPPGVPHAYEQLTNLTHAQTSAAFRGVGGAALMGTALDEAPSSLQLAQALGADPGLPVSALPPFERAQSGLSFAWEDHTWQAPYWMQELSQLSQEQVFPGAEFSEGPAFLAAPTPMVRPFAKKLAPQLLTLFEPGKSLTMQQILASDVCLTLPQKRVRDAVTTLCKTHRLERVANGVFRLAHAIDSGQAVTAPHPMRAHQAADDAPTEAAFVRAQALAFADQRGAQRWTSKEFLDHLHAVGGATIARDSVYPILAELVYSKALEKVLRGTYQKGPAAEATPRPLRPGACKADIRAMFGIAQANKPLGHDQTALRLRDVYARMAGANFSQAAIRCALADLVACGELSYETNGKVKEYKVPMLQGKRNVQGADSDETVQPAKRQRLADGLTPD